MKSIILFLFFFAIIFITIGYIKQQTTCPPANIEYRYIPRTFEEEQENPVLVSQLFADMFEEPSAWIAGTKFDGNLSRNNALNKYNITSISDNNRHLLDINQYNISQS